ncbi:uncharacterized protein LOC126800799 [Argentina anserina]|uniref:uncharacterized protein LOC126800799 n=1 Tax=Argentina anserina TaxID=57926 RepID=UPI0021767C98|nr:uncharacterized protein LOC126800799 [Potentilla anserina]
MGDFLISDTMDDGKTGRDGEILDSGTEYKWGEELLNYMKSKTFHTAIIGFSLLSVAAASLALLYHSRQKKAINKDSLVIANTGSMKNLIIEQKKMIEKESTTSEKYNSAFANREEDDSIEQGVYSSFRRMSLSSNSNLSSSKGSEGCHNKAPRVELLGEFVIGDISSPLRSCGLKNQMKEGEQSNYELRTQAHSVSIQQQPSVSEFSFIGSFSHKSYTSEKKIKPTESEISSMDTSHGSYTSEKIVKIKEGGKNGEVKVIATPVRRSSRIHSKTVMSP